MMIRALNARLAETLMLSMAFAMLTAATPAQAQTPVGKILDKIPSLFGTPRQPDVPRPPTPSLPGITIAAAKAVPGDVTTYDLGGFRLGMDEEQIEAVRRARNLSTGRVLRVVDFETGLRSAINVRGGTGGQVTRKSVLGEAELKDPAGGTYLLKTTVWPDGAHLTSVTYLAPAGTSAADWGGILAAKWGKPSTSEITDMLSARWTGGGAGARASAAVGARGGYVSLENAEGTRGRPAKLISDTVDTYFASKTRRPTL